jgi:hypothetical protein
VVEEPTPIISNGLTTQAVKFVFLGKRETFIPAGRPVPVVAQYFNSDPRPRLTLYRGATDSEDADQFLGHFEVLGLPKSGDLNISTLCVVANGKIILCARDNQRDALLGIRRLETEITQ